MVPPSSQDEALGRKVADGLYHSVVKHGGGIGSAAGLLHLGIASRVFEIASQYCISNSFVDHDGHSISSEGFLPTVVDIMVI